MGEGDWISVEDRLPEIDTTRPSYEWHVAVITRTASGHVGEMRYTINASAKTERGRKPQWKAPDGNRMAWCQPTHWMPLPPPPKAD